MTPPTHRFGLERNIVAVSAAVFLMALGENLWKRFVPKYLEALGAPVTAIGIFGSCQDLLDGVYQYPGGWIGDRYGRRRALLLFVTMAAVGYALYWAAPSWPFIFVGLLFVMAWSSMASPTLFAVVGDALPKERRTMGFTVQAILRRIPIAIAPLVGGYVIARSGLLRGMHVLFIGTIGCGVVTLFVVTRVRIERIAGHPTNIRGVWRAIPVSLRRLLLSDIFIRTCEGLVDEFGVIYAMTIIGVSAPQYGLLIAVQMVTSIIVYIPAATIAGRIGAKPFVILTFLMFSFFSVAIVLSKGFRVLLLSCVTV